MTQGHMEIVQARANTLDNRSTWAIMVSLGGHGQKSAPDNGGDLITRRCIENIDVEIDACSEADFDIDRMMVIVMQVPALPTAMRIKLMLNSGAVDKTLKWVWCSSNSWLCL